MSAARTRRDAEVALIAFFRAAVLDGEEILSPAKLATLVGLKKTQAVDPLALDWLVLNKHVRLLGENLELTQKGRSAASSLLEKDRK